MIYNHRMDGVCEAFSRVPGSERWGGIALAVSNPGDVVQMHPSLRTEEPAIRAHYDRCGIPVASSILWDDDFRHLAGHGSDGISVAAICDGVHRHCPDPHWLSAHARFDDKNEFIRWCEGAGVPVPQTVCLGDGRDAANHGLEYPVFVKDARSLAGLGIVRCADRFALEQATRSRRDAFQVQKSVPRGSQFLNVQYQSDRGRASYLTTTRQILHQYAHQGNSSPVGMDVRSVTDPAAAALVALGLRGVFAFDVAAAGSLDALRCWVLECNPRWNGSSYLWFTARKLGTPSWTGLMMGCPRGFDSMDLGDLEYRRSTGEGWVIVDWTRCRQGWAFLLAVGSPLRQGALVTALTQRRGWRLPFGDGIPTPVPTVGSALETKPRPNG